MTGALWPCSKCGAAGVKNLYGTGRCAVHLAETVRKFNPAIFGGIGVGIPTGAPSTTITFADGSTLHPVDGILELACNVCEATWSGPPLDTCGWCLDWTERQRAWQAKLTLTPPDVDRDDRRFEPQMKAWGERLAVAVEAGTISKDDARRAWRRHAVGEVADVAA